MNHLGSNRCWDTNSRPLEHESRNVTTRPVLQPKVCQPESSLKWWAVVMVKWSACFLQLQRSSYRFQFHCKIVLKTNENKKKRPGWIEAVGNERKRRFF